MNENPETSPLQVEGAGHQARGQGERKEHHPDQEPGGTGGFSEALYVQPHGGEMALF